MCQLGKVLELIACEIRLAIGKRLEELVWLPILGDINCSQKREELMTELLEIKLQGSHSECLLKEIFSSQLLSQKYYSMINPRFVG